MANSTNPAHVAGGSAGAVIIESVADVLERELDAVIQEWLKRVDKEPELAAVPLSFEDRTGHLPQLLRDVIVRLRLDDDTKGRGFDDGGSSRRFTRQTGLHGGNGGGGISVASG